MVFQIKQGERQLFAFLPIVVPFLFILAGEVMLFIGKPDLCMSIHLLNILLCIFAPILLRQDVLLWQSFMLVSMLRAINLAMPTFHELTLLWMPLIYAPIILVCLLMIRDESRNWLSYLREFKLFFNISRATAGWKIYYIPLALIIALVAANIEFAILSMTIPDLRLIPELNIEYLALLFIIMVFFVGLGEELVFRYILQSRLHAALGIAPALMLSSAAFALMHSGYTSLVYVAYVFCISLVLGLIYYRTKSLAFVTIIHGLLNFFLFSFLPFGYLHIF